MLQNQICIFGLLTITRGMPLQGIAFKSMYKLSLFIRWNYLHHIFSSHIFIPFQLFLLLASTGVIILANGEIVLQYSNYTVSHIFILHFHYIPIISFVCFHRRHSHSCRRLDCLATLRTLASLVGTPCHIILIFFLSAEYSHQNSLPYYFDIVLISRIFSSELPAILFWYCSYQQNIFIRTPCHIVFYSAEYSQRRLD